MLGKKKSHAFMRYMSLKLGRLRNVWNSVTVPCGVLIVPLGMLRWGPSHCEYSLYHIAKLVSILRLNCLFTMDISVIAPDALFLARISTTASESIS